MEPTIIIEWDYIMVGYNYVGGVVVMISLLFDNVVVVFQVN